MTEKQPELKQQNPSHTNRRSMTGQLVLGLSLIVLLASLLSFGTGYLISNNKAKNNLQEEADRYLAYLTKTFEPVIWNMDYQTVEQIGEVYMNSELFSFIEILSYEKKEISIFNGSNPQDDDLIYRESLLKNGEEIIGEIRIGFSKIPYKKELKRLLGTSLLITAAIVLAMTISALIMLLFFVRQPMDLLLEVADSMSHGEYHRIDRDIKYSEIAIIYDQLFNMASNIESRELSLKKANEELLIEINRRKESENESRVLRNYLSNIINSMPSVLIAVDSVFNVTLWNNKAEEITGVSSEIAEKQPLGKVFPRIEDELDNLQKAIHTREVQSGIRKHYSQSTNEIFYEDMTIFPLVTNGVEGAVIHIDDVTEKVRLEEMMIQSEKMLSVGGLAAGMAHEINNPLAGILQTAGVLSSRLGDLDIPANRKAAANAGTTLSAINSFMDSRGILRMISTIVESGRRVSDIINNMLSFARKSDTVRSSHPLEELIDKTLELASTDFDLKKKYDFKRIKIIKEYKTNNVLVPCESSKVQQVLLNIFRNGAEAMEEAGTENPQFIITSWINIEEQMLCISIKDNGPGMDEAVRKRIFEPFFTTKPIGVGTGLGLSVSYFIITENHGGKMVVDSEPANGTVFTCCLPLSTNSNQVTV